MKSAVTRVRTAVRARPWVSAAVVVAVVGASIAVYLVTGRSSGAQAQTAVATRLVAVSTGSVQEAVSATGTLSPADSHEVSFSSSATITSVRVAVGQKVAKGAVLGTIDTLSLTATLAQAKATLAGAKSTLATAQDSSSTTSTQLTADKTSVSTANAAVTAAKTQLTDATLRSPIAGTVAAVNVAKGDQSSGSSGSSGGSAGATGGSGSSGSSGGSGGTTGGSTAASTTSTGDFEVVGLQKWTAAASVDDTEVGLISRGDQVQITTDGVTSRFFGIVSSVSVLSSSTSGSASYPVEVAVTGNPSGLHDGASATLSIIYKQVSNVLTVPTTAVHRSGTASYVYVSSSGAKTKRTVTAGLSSSGTTQITSGLTSGMQVYVETVTAGVGSSTRGTGTQNRTGTGTGGYGGGFPGGGTGNFPGGGTGNFPGGGQGNFPGGVQGGNN